MALILRFGADEEAKVRLGKIERGILQGSGNSNIVAKKGVHNIVAKKECTRFIALGSQLLISSQLYFDDGLGRLR